MLRKRLFAWLISRSDDFTNRLYGDHKKTLLSDLSGMVLEIGAGTGANLPFYPPDIRWIAVEPNPEMHPYLKKKAEMYHIPADLRVCKAQELDLPDNSVDAVVGTLVLCSVDNPHSVVNEVLRVLKPGGRFVFIEHVAAPHGTGLRKIQSRLTHLWKWLADGCHLDRETWTTIEHAGFEQLRCEHFCLSKGTLKVLSTNIAGTATKASVALPK